MGADEYLETLQGLSRDERLEVSDAVMEELGPRQFFNLAPEVETSIMHEGSGIHVSVSPITGGISVFGAGNPYQGDPLMKTGIEFDPQTGTVYTSSDFEITPEGEVKNFETEASYELNLREGSQNPNLTDSDVSVPVVDAGTFAEEGITTLYSDDGLLEVTIYDRGRMSQGAVDIQYTNPETGMITKMSADENTFTVSTMDADGQVLSSGPVEMENTFSENDFRYQAPAPDTPGLGN